MELKVDVEYSSCTEDLAADMYEEQSKAFYTIAKRIRDAAWGLVPVLTGALRSTIRAARSRRKGALARLRQYITSEGGYYKDDPAAFVIAGDRNNRLGKGYIYYPFMVEYGTYDKPAHPFLRPAAYANFNPLLAEAERAGKRALNKRRRLRKRAKKALGR